MEASPLASGLKGKARDILAAIRTLKQIEQEHRPASAEERRTLARFGGFGAVALHLFPDPRTSQYKDAGWQALGEALRTMLTPEEYDSARRTTFTAFYTSPAVMRAMHEALRRLGVPRHATVLEPGCGIGHFMAEAPEGMRFIGVELDSLSGRIARALHPGQDIRIENFRDTRLPGHGVDAVIGNVPFADVKLDFHGRRLPLHNYFLAKSLDALKPGGVLALSPPITRSTSRIPSCASNWPHRPTSWAPSACPSRLFSARAPEW
jgi:SAM-dependent methyltransferase